MEVLKYLRAAQHTHPFLLLTHFLKPILINQTHVPLPNNFHIVHHTTKPGVEGKNCQPATLQQLKQELL